jgi:hypothetical protein
MRCVSVLALAATLAQPGLAQAQDKLPKWKLDPYTKNKPEALQKAGYVSYGPFPFGYHGSGPMTTEQVEKHLSYVQLLWVETPHFRIGTDLPTYTIPLEPEFKNKIRAELERLAEKIPNVNPKTRTLDPWLRLHLFAQRCEDLYAEFSQLAGVKDADFPAPGGATQPGGVYMGMGPYLGMRDKYLLLLVNKEGTFKDYMKNYLGRDSKFGQRWHFKDIGALIYTISCDSMEGRLKDDTAMHCDVAFNISQNLLDGFRHYSYDLPVWMREGIGHWFNRRVNRRFNSFDQNEGSTADMKNEWEWEVYCRMKLVQGGGKFAPFSEAFTWRDFGSITFNDHVAVWSRIDFMMSMGQEKWRAFLFEVKGRTDIKGLADQSDLVGATRQALQKAYGLNVLDFDSKWAEWVKATYPAQ